MNRFRSFQYHLMSGRNGNDSLNIFLLALYLLLVLVRTVIIFFHPSYGVYYAFSAANTLVLLLILFRMFSRNLDKRRRENVHFLRWFNPKKQQAKCLILGLKDKNHCYSACPVCSTICRVPRGRGKLEVTCPTCHNKTIVKS